MNTKNFKIDNLQYCNWSKEIFEINNEAKLDAIHVTIAYHEDFKEVEKNISVWNNHFKNFNISAGEMTPTVFGLSNFVESYLLWKH